jgi:hypothetical protein|tara:strand:+ start:817 stop:1074 length:258 start_codon:yes stop_codon:yes gene_type:complete
MTAVRESIRIDQLRSNVPEVSHLRIITTSSFDPEDQPIFERTIHDRTAEILTNIDVISSELRAPTDFPKRPVTKAPINGKNNINE